MPNKPGNDDRSFEGGDRERQRGLSNEMGRSASPTGTDPRPSGAAGNTANGTGGTGGTGQRQRSNRGFASMDQSKQKEIASKGGRAAHAKGTAHEFDSGEAREAGRKGGLAVSRNREHMANIGRRGGEARGAARGKAAAQANTAGEGANAEGAFQNSRRPAVAARSDREVELNSNAATTDNEGVNTSTQGNRGGNASVGGERRPNATPDDSRDRFGNH
jgi:general stress protein YciG